jgi:hypothetical protein
MIIYCIDKADNTREQTRKVTIDFFEKVLGFKNENIIIVNRNEFFVEHKKFSYRTKFSDETKELMKIFARSVFGDKK